MRYLDLLDTIYCKYYENFEKPSPVTSCFWQEFGNRHIVKRQNGKWVYFGYGLGSFVSKSIRHSIRHLPVVFLSKRLLEKYHCTKKLKKIGYLVADLSERIFNFDCAKQVLAVNEIGRQLSLSMDVDTPFSQAGIRTVCIIGDGYSFCSNLLKMLDKRLRVVCVNLGRSLFFDILFSQKCLQAENAVLISEEHNKLSVFDSHKLIFIEAEKYDLLKGLPIDLYISITAMQEMNPETVNGYFKYMRQSAARNVYFYCCSRLEKILPDQTAVRFMEYPWNSCKVILDELCPWHQKYPEAGIPVWRKFDGPIQHRLVKF